MISPASLSSSSSTSGTSSGSICCSEAPSGGARLVAVAGVRLAAEALGVACRDAADFGALVADDDDGWPAAVVLD